MKRRKKFISMVQIPALSAHKVWEHSHRKNHSLLVITQVPTLGSHIQFLFCFPTHFPSPHSTELYLLPSSPTESFQCYLSLSSGKRRLWDSSTQKLTATDMAGCSHSWKHSLHTWQQHSLHTCSRPGKKSCLQLNSSNKQVLLLPKHWCRLTQL